MAHNTLHNATATDHGSIHVGDVHQIVHHHQKTEEEIQDAYLAKLKTTDPCHDKSRIEDIKGGLLGEPYHWIRDDETFRKWSEGNNGGILWVKGGPGKGKTMLLCGIINDLSPSTKLEDADAKKLLAFFFCEATNQKLSNAAAVLRGLVYVLVKQHPLLLSHVRKNESDEDGLDPRHHNSRIIIEKILFEILNDDALPETYLIIDALDECEVDLSFLLEFVTSISSSRIKWIISNRHRDVIQEKIEPVEHKFLLDLDIDRSSNLEAVNKYIGLKVDDLAERKKYKDATKSAVLDYVSLNAHGTFLWVALSLQELDKYKRWEIERELKEGTLDLPAGLNKLYDKMMERIEVRATSFQTYRQLLAVISAAYRPISVAELKCFEDFANYDEDIPDIIQECGCFLTLTNKTIYFVHKSAKDFLLSYRSQQLFPSGLAQQHYNMFSQCLQAMEILEQDMYRLKDPGVDIGQARYRCPNPNPLDIIGYACNYWAHHFVYPRENCEEEQLSRLNVELCNGGKVPEFLKEKFLFWLEALIILDSYSNGISILTVLDECLQEISHLETSDLSELIDDARRFMLYFRACTEGFPLQLYVSGLLFSPTKSLIRQLFENRCNPNWISIKPDVYSHWNSDLQMIQCRGYIQSLAFTSNGKLAILPSNGIIMIADATDSAVFQMSQYGQTLRAAISADGLSLAIITMNDELELWDLDANVKKWAHAVEHANEIQNLALSSNCQWLAICYLEETQLWDATKGCCNTKVPLRFEQGFFEYPGTSATFSGDGCLLAVPSQLSVIVVNTQNWKTYQHHLDDGFTSMAFRPHSHQLILTVRGLVGCWEWDIDRGICQPHDSLHGSAVYTALAFSQNDQLQAASDQQVLYVYKTSRTESNSYRIRGNSVFSSIAFSPDNRKLAAGDSDGVVRVWDLVQMQYQPPSAWEDNISEIVAISNDGNLAASSSNSNIIIWDANRCCQIQTLLGHTDDIHCLSFAPDGHFLASTSYDNTIRIWDIRNCHESIMNISVIKSVGPVWHLAMGANGTLAFVCDDVYLCNIYTKEREEVIHVSDYIEGEVWGGSPRQLALSSDGKWLALSIFDRPILLKNIATGCVRRIYQELQVHDYRYSTYLAFSLNSTWLTCSGPENTTVIDVQTLSSDQIFRGALHPIKFQSDSIISTQHGILDVKNAVSSTGLMQDSDSLEISDPIYSSWGFDEDNFWITYDGRKVLWTPAEYRVQGYQIAIAGNRILWVYSFGRLCMIGFSDKVSRFH